MKDGRGYSNILRQSDFSKNTKLAEAAELIVADLVPQIWTDITDVKWVADDPRYYHKGDVVGKDIWNEEIGFEVKDDGAIHETGNVFCEHRRLAKDGTGYVNGFMKREMGEYLCVVSRKIQHVWFFDFAALRQIYEQGRYVQTRSQTKSSGFLLAIAALRRDGQLLVECDYELQDGYATAVNVEYYTEI